ncbi:PREDICTED: uncharacterized protein LOC109360351 [Lupinus angustifolius]|uniref:uncharacterized protein LOC109360351 n=1 Tax=Lupinus angustifolius TaxID=3871 RepID=UPI00092F469E|nr:PREDICTED: uncharacterized protein LOC109360351 [Lupinus angustifolius]
MELVETSQWPELSEDLLHEIGKLLHSYDDYYRLRMVCKEWNKVLPQIPNHPWLVLPFDDKAIETRVAEEKIYYVKLPELHTSKLRGSCFGWLMVVEFDGTLRMLNPFTRKHKELPPISTFPDIVEYNPDREKPYTIKDFKFFNEDGNNSYSEEDDDDEDDDAHSYDDPNADSYDEADDSNEDSYDEDDNSNEGDDDPNEDDDRNDSYICPGSTYDDDYKQEDFMAIAIYGQYNRLAFCKRGDNKWTDIPKSQKDDVDADYDYEDVIFHQGKIYVIDSFTKIFEYDIKTSSTPLGRIIEIPKPHDLSFLATNWKFAYLIGCLDGGLLMVVRHINFYRVLVQNVGFNSPKFDIYKLEKGAKQWSRVFDLKNYALLIGFNLSVLMSANIFPNGWENRVHYTDNVLPSQFFKSVGGYDIGVFNLEDGKSTLLFPDITVLSSPPIWLV